MKCKFLPLAKLVVHFNASDHMANNILLIWVLLFFFFISILKVEVYQVVSVLLYFY